MSSSYLCVYKPRNEVSYVTGCKPYIRNDDDRRFMLFRLIKPREETYNCTPVCTASTDFFIIKCTCNDKEVFLKVKNDKDEIEVTDKMDEASKFHMKTEKCNYFKILHKRKDNPYSLHLSGAQVKWFSSTCSPLKLSLNNDEEARSYLAFYVCSMSSLKKPHPRLHVTELSKAVNESKNFYISCQYSVNSKDMSYLCVIRGKKSENPKDKASKQALTENHYRKEALKEENPRNEARKKGLIEENPRDEAGRKASTEENPRDKARGEALTEDNPRDETSKEASADANPKNEESEEASVEEKLTTGNVSKKDENDRVFTKFTLIKVKTDKDSSAQHVKAKDNEDEERGGATSPPDSQYYDCQTCPSP